MNGIYRLQAWGWYLPVLDVDNTNIGDIFQYNKFTTSSIIKNLIIMWFGEI